MANPSRRPQPRTSRLFLEAFERRDLLSGTPVLLNPLFSSSPLSVQPSQQTSNWTPSTLNTVDLAAVEQQILNIFTLIENSLASTTSSTPLDGLSANSQVQSTDTTSTVQGGTDLTGGTAVHTDTSPASDGTVTAPISVQLNHLSLVNNDSTVSSTPITTDTNGQGQQSDTASSTTEGTVSPRNDSVADNSTSSTQASSDAKAALQGEVASYDATNSGQRTSVYSVPSDNPVVTSSVVALTPAIPTSLSPSMQMNSVASGSVQSTGHVAVGDSSGRDHGNIRAIAADIRPAIIRDLYFTSLQDTSRGRTDSDATSNRPSADVLTLFLNKPRSTEGFPDLDRIGLSYDRLAHLDKAFAELDYAPVSARSRRDAAVNLQISEIVFGAPLKEQDSGTVDQGEENEAAAGPVSASARGAGLLGSPLLFDLDSLAQEAQNFFGQIEQMGQDLAGLFGRTNLLSGLVAIGLAASAFQVARRRKQRAAQALVLQGCTDTTFTGYPGLGSTWTWEEK